MNPPSIVEPQMHRQRRVGVEARQRLQLRRRLQSVLRLTVEYAEPAWPLQLDLLDRPVPPNRELHHVRADDALLVVPLRPDRFDHQFQVLLAAEIDCVNLHASQTTAAARAHPESLTANPG